MCTTQGSRVPGGRSETVPGRNVLLLMALPPASSHCEDTVLETRPKGEGREGIPDLAHTAGLTQGADGSHVALVPRAEFRGVVAG